MKKEKREELRQRVVETQKQHYRPSHFDEEDLQPQAPLDCSEALALLNAVDDLEMQHRSLVDLFARTIMHVAGDTVSGRLVRAEINNVLERAKHPAGPVRVAT